MICEMPPHGAGTGTAHGEPQTGEAGTAQAGVAQAGAAHSAVTEHVAGSTLDVCL